MSTHQIDFEELSAALEATEQRIVDATIASLQKNDDRIAILRRATPKDLGALRDGWKTVKATNGSTIANSAPYAQDVEKGAGPRQLGDAERAAVAAWAKRHTRPGASVRQQNIGISRLIKQLEYTGQKPQFFVKKVMPKLEEQTGKAIDIALSKDFG